MKPHLVIGLGNRLMGDEGVGWHIIDRLAGDPRLPPDTEVLWGGTDLLACADQVAGRSRITLVDALLDPSQAGSVAVFEADEALHGLEEGKWHVHHLSLTQAIYLLQIASPSATKARLRIIAIGISSARMQPELSPELAVKLPRIMEQVVQELV